MKALTAAQKIELTTILESGAEEAEAAEYMRISLPRVRAFILTLQPIPALPPVDESKLDKEHYPVITQKLMDACQFDKTFLNIDFFKLVNLDPIRDHDWYTVLLYRPVTPAVYRAMVQIAKSLGKDPGPMVKLNQLTPRKRYDLFREANPVVTVVDDH
jgi:hypothetical protein